jgi:hypothetical protein
MIFSSNQAHFIFGLRAAQNNVEEISDVEWFVPRNSQNLNTYQILYYLKQYFELSI